MTFDTDYALAILPGLLQAAVVTFEATIGGFLLAIVLGLLLAIARLAGPRPVSTAAAGYVEIVRSTPLLIQLFFLFYVLPRYGITTDPLMTGILALGMHYSTYASEVYRAGVQGVPRGQWEASSALNLSALRIWTRVILPQAIPPVIPPLGNYLIGMFKDTTLLATITVQELFGTALTDASRTFRFFEPFTLVGLIFLTLSYPSSLVVRRLEVRLGRR